MASIIPVAELESVNYRIFSPKFNFIIEECHKIITGKGCRNAGFNRTRALSQPGYSAKKDPGFILVFFYQC